MPTLGLMFDLLLTMIYVRVLSIQKRPSPEGKINTKVVLFFPLYLSTVGVSKFSYPKLYDLSLKFKITDNYKYVQVSLLSANLLLNSQETRGIIRNL